MSKDNKNWTQYEDNALKELREGQGITKWSIIAKTLSQQYQIQGKSAKRCRERYHNHVNSLMNKEGWTTDEESLLLELHNEVGNKWVEIGRKLKRSDNAVKNHYHSKLRMALRRINRLLAEWLKGEFKPLKNNIISKIIQTAEDYYSQAHQDQPTTARQCFNLKNKVIKYLKKTEDKPTDDQLLELRLMVREMNHFNKTYKKKNKPKSDANKETYRSNEYKGKEILNLINENRRLQQDDQQISEEESIQRFSSEREVANPNNNSHLVNDININQLCCFRSSVVQPMFYYGGYSPTLLDPINFYQHSVNTQFYNYYQGLSLANFDKGNQQNNWAKVESKKIILDHASSKIIQQTMPDLSVLQNSINDKQQSND